MTAAGGAGTLIPPMVAAVPFRGPERLRWHREFQQAVAEDTRRTADMLLHDEGWRGSDIDRMLRHGYPDWVSRLVADAVEMALDLWILVNFEEPAA